MSAPGPHTDPIQEAQELLKHPGANVSVKGSKPWRSRGVSRSMGLISSLVLYAATLTPAELGLGTTALIGASVGKAVLSEPVQLDTITVTAPAPVAAFEVPDTMTPQEVSQKLLDMGKPFQALAVTLEGLETKPYRDGCGLNVGMGYCIDARVRELGVERVREDLANAGLDDTQVQTLMGNDRKAQSQIEISRTQALSLLALTENDYRVRARDIIGQRVFDKLPQHRQAALTWLSYNTGDGLAKFSNLLSAVRKDQTAEAVKHMTPFFSQGGEMVPNARAGSWMMAAYWSEDALKEALKRPDALESGSRNGQSPLAIVAPKEAGRMAMAGTLPPSPFVAHGKAELSGATQVATAQLASVEAPTASPAQDLMPAQPKSVAEWQQTRQARAAIILSQSKANQTGPQGSEGQQSNSEPSLLDNLDDSSRARFSSPRR